MRLPIATDHTRHQFQVIFRRRGGIRNWNIYTDAGIPEDAVREARLVLAHDRYKYRSDMDPDTSRLTADRDWEVAEINRLSHVGAAVLRDAT